MQCTVRPAAMAAAVLFASAPALASRFEPRDLNGDFVRDAFFDSLTGLTWLQDADAVRGTPFDVPTFPIARSMPPAIEDDPVGYAAWHAANTAERQDGLVGLSVAGAWVRSIGPNWRLPLASTDRSACIFGGEDSYTLCVGGSAFGGELATLLGGSESPPAVHLTAGPFWTTSASTLPVTDGLGIEYTFLGQFVVPGTSTTGLFATTGRGFEGWQARTWAVHTGDIGTPVPEPTTYALLVGGLTLVGAASRLRSRLRSRSDSTDALNPQATGRLSGNRTPLCFRGAPISAAGDLATSGGVIAGSGSLTDFAGTVVGQWACSRP